MNVFESLAKAEGELRLCGVNSKLAGYAAAKEVLAFFYRSETDRAHYEDVKKDAMNIALKTVAGRKYLGGDMMQSIPIEDALDVEMSIRELIRVANIKDSVDDFLTRIIFS